MTYAKLVTKVQLTKSPKKNLDAKVMGNLCQSYTKLMPPIKMT